MTTATRQPASYERLTAADTVFLRIETPHEPQHVGSLSVLEGAPVRDADGRIRFEELRSHVDRRLQAVPRLRQRVMEVPYGQGRPVWVDDDQFDIDYHVRLTALPRPGDDEQLAALMSRVQALALDRRRPLWEMWFVDGIDGDRVGMIIKTHHALGDGIANVDLALALVDLEPDPPTEREPEPWTPRPAPSPNELLAASVRDQLTRPGRMAQRAVNAARDPGSAISATWNVVRAVTEFAAKPNPAPWNVPVSPHRRWTHASIPMEQVRHVRKRHGVKLNDVVLAACSGALRAFLIDHQPDRIGDDRGGSNTDPTIDLNELTAMVPVSLRKHDQHGETLGNLVSMMLVELPVDEPDPVERLLRVQATTSELKADEGLVDGAHAVLDLADAFTPVAAPLTRFVSRSIPMNLVITNVPGPPMPLYLCGARFERIYPYVEVIDNEGLTIAVVSYDDHLFFGLTGDRDVLADLDDLAAAIESSFTELAAS